MKKMMFSLFLLMVCTWTYAQKWETGVKAGFSTFAMKDLKSDLERSIQDLPFEARIVTEFPSWFSFGGYLRCGLGIYSLGFEYDYNSTASRISTSDYSGSYHFDELLSGHAFGMINAFRILRLGHFDAELSLNIGYLYTSMKTEEYLEALGTVIEFDNFYYSDSYYIKPGLIVSYSWRFLKFGAEFGYLWDKKGEIKSDSVTLIKPYTTDWTGFRAEIRVGVCLDELLPKKK